MRVTTARGAEDVIALFSTIGATAWCAVLAAVGQGVKDFFYLICKMNHYIVVVVVLNREMLIHTYDLSKLHLLVFNPELMRCGDGLPMAMCISVHI